MTDTTLKGLESPKMKIRSLKDRDEDYQEEIQEPRFKLRLTQKHQANKVKMSK